MHKILSSAAVVCLTLAGFTSTASAATITLGTTSRGRFDDNGKAFGVGHGSASASYFAGRLVDGDGNNIDYRNFFIFDLSGVTDVIVAASFRITPWGFQTPDGSETFSLFDVTTPLASLTDKSGGLTAFADLGSGTSYGSRDFTWADPYNVPVTIALNGAALADLQAAVGTPFGLGGAITTLNGAAQQYVFGLSETHLVQLVLETQPAPPPPPAVPEPATLMLLGTGLVACAPRWRRRLRA